MPSYSISSYLLYSSLFLLKSPQSSSPTLNSLTESLDKLDLVWLAFLEVLEVALITWSWCYTYELKTYAKECGYILIAVDDS